MNLLELHHTEIKNVAWFPPNLMREWASAKQHPEFFETRTSWLDIARQGNVMTFHPNVHVKIANLSEKGTYKRIPKEKRDRVEKAFEDGQVEMPILFHKKDGTYEMVAGNARFTYAMDNEIPVKALVIAEPKNIKEDDKKTPKKDKK